MAGTASLRRGVGCQMVVDRQTDIFFFCQNYYLKQVLKKVIPPFNSISAVNPQTKNNVFGQKCLLFHRSVLQCFSWYRLPYQQWFIKTDSHRNKFFFTNSPSELSCTYLPFSSLSTKPARTKLSLTILWKLPKPQRWHVTHTHAFPSPSSWPGRHTRIAVIRH